MPGSPRRPTAAAGEGGEPTEGGSLSGRPHRPLFARQKAQRTRARLAAGLTASDQALAVEPTCTGRAGNTRRAGGSIRTAYVIVITSAAVMAASCVAPARLSLFRSGQDRAHGGGQRQRPLAKSAQEIPPRRVCDRLFRQVTEFVEHRVVLYVKKQLQLGAPFCPCATGTHIPVRRPLRHVEPGARPLQTRSELASQIRTLAAWASAPRAKSPPIAMAAANAPRPTRPRNCRRDARVAVCSAS
jgi:hypothetical protein